MFSHDVVDMAEDEVIDDESVPASSISCKLRMYSTAQRNVSTLLTLRLLLLLLLPPEEDRPLPAPLPLLLASSQKAVGMCWRRTANPMLTCLTRLRSRALRRATEAGGAGGRT